MSIVTAGVVAMGSLREETKRRLVSQREFEETIRHLTPQRQAELMAIRQIALECARKRR